MVQLLWKSLAVPQMITKRVTIWPLSNSTPRYNSREIKTYVHRKTCIQMLIAALFKNKEKVETLTRPSTEERKKMWYLHNGVFFRHNEARSTDSRRDMDQPWKHCAQGKKPIQKARSYDSIYIKCTKKANRMSKMSKLYVQKRDRKQISDGHSRGRRARGMTADRNGFLSEVMKHSEISDGYTTLWLH